MSKTKTIREVDIVDAVRKYLEAQGLTVRSEVPVTLPDHGQVFADLVGMKAGSDGEYFTVVECKRRLDAELEAQSMRWLEYADYVCCAYVNQASDSRNRARIDRIDSVGIGRFGYSEAEDSLRVREWPAPQADDTRLISTAFHSHSGEHDPAGGSAAAKRMTAERCQWEPLRKWFDRINVDGSWRAMWTTIQRQVPEMRRYTAAAARKAIDRGECVGIAYEGHSLTEFYATEKP